jgi:hypothetical protein
VWTGEALNLSKADGLVQFWKLSPGGSNLVPVREDSWDNCPHWEGGNFRWFQFFVIRILSVLSFLEYKVIVKLL